eukprot:TRINITY_DN110741_c0_g1_i1.p1 TRINITY_DN110741_c0_g1~~TRINITY_DN110741_c0_g1_i1.p1  ORF type:complete len:189 (-),score=33.88 TRINITY_DN110741_c0_g1_i1:45-611(-)
MDERRSNVKPKIAYLIGVVLLLCVTLVRFKVSEDHHGALIMGLQCFLALLGLVFDSEVDMECCKNCGIMSLIGCALDLSIAIETIGKERLPPLQYGEKMPTVWVFIFSHLAYSIVQMLWAMVCYYVVISTEDSLWGDEGGMLIATQEDARIYGAAMSWAELRRERTPPRRGSAKEAAETYFGTAHKIP